MTSKSTNVFVSYSHSDASLVAPVVKLLRVNKSLVFQDVDDIKPGKKWRREVARGLAESNLVVIFWCDHARRSDEVAMEWKAAIEQQKDLLPLLLDATPLPSELSEFQWIDFRETVGPHHGSISEVDRTEYQHRNAYRDEQRIKRESVSASRSAPMSRPRSGWPLAAVLATLVGAAFVLNVMFERGSDTPPAITSDPPDVFLRPVPPPKSDVSPMPDVARQPAPSPGPDVSPKPVPYKPDVVPQPPPYPGPDVAPKPVPSSGPPSHGLFDFLFSAGTLIGLALIVAAMSAIWVGRRRSYRATSHESVAPYPHELEQRIAAKVETEILRRTHRSS